MSPTATRRTRSTRSAATPASSKRLEVRKTDTGSTIRLHTRRDTTAV